MVGNHQNEKRAAFAGCLSRELADLIPKWYLSSWAIGSSFHREAGSHRAGSAHANSSAQLCCT